MAEQLYNPGLCEVTKAAIIPFGGGLQESEDITALIYAFQINQGTGRVSLYGTIEVLDTIGLIERMPLRGEEDIELSIKSYDIDFERTINGKIYKIDGRQPVQNGNGSRYTLHFLTNVTYDANLKYIIKAFVGQKAHEAATALFKEHYGNRKLDTPISTSEEREDLPEGTKKYSVRGKNLYIQETTGNLRVNIPRLSASEAIGFLAARSFSKATASSSFRFFETYDSYYYVTDDWLLEYAARNEKVKEFEHVMYVNKEPEDAYNQIRSIEVMTNPRRVDVADEMLGGAYKNQVIEVDILRHKVNTYNYDYLETPSSFIEENTDNINLSKKRKIKQNFKSSNGKQASPSSDIHTQEFIDQTFTENNAKRFFIVRDYTKKLSGSGLSKDETFYREMSAFRNMYTRHLNATKVQVGFRGRLDIEAGQVIKINIRELDSGGNPVENKQLSGRYLVQTVMHKMEQGVLSTLCGVCKYDWSDTPTDNEERI